MNNTGNLLNSKFARWSVGVAAIIVALAALPYAIKAVAVTGGMLAAAAVLAGVFLLGVFIAILLLSPLWVPFLAGWAAVRYCKKHYVKKEGETKV